LWKESSGNLLIQMYPANSHLNSQCCRLLLLPSALCEAHAALFSLHGNFDVFRPSGTTCCTDRCDIWRGGVSKPNITPIGARMGVWSLKTENFTKCTDGVIYSAEELTTPSITTIGSGVECMTPKLKILTNFYQFTKYKCIAPAHPLHNFYEVFMDCGELRAGPHVKTITPEALKRIFLKGFWSYIGFHLRGSGNTQIFSTL